MNIRPNTIDHVFVRTDREDRNNIIPKLLVSSGLLAKGTSILLKGNVISTETAIATIGLATILAGTMPILSGINLLETSKLQIINRKKTNELLMDAGSLALTGSISTLYMAAVLELTKMVEPSPVFPTVIATGMLLGLGLIILGSQRNISDRIDP